MRSQGYAEPTPDCLPGSMLPDQLHILLDAPLCLTRWRISDRRA